MFLHSAQHAAEECERHGLTCEVITFSVSGAAIEVRYDGIGTCFWRMRDFRRWLREERHLPDGQKSENM